ncbi:MULTISPECIES: S-4TM family putative pore-forming effector [Streptomyces]|uniref:S-4TM family putative pore-forming effector n=1 Tax=Streptomyces TaxID=1883 RepID=UPI0013DB189F|nr:MULTISPECIES: S-4TM family putative pore-forming effector [unclassified Streptomyces]
MSPRTLLPIVEHQNDPEMLRLLRAASASHARAQRLASGHVVVSTALAVGAVVGVFVPVSLTPLSLVGLVWAVVYAVGASAWTKNEFRRAALLQETFDTRLFGLPWNHVLVGREPSADEISRLARHYRGSPARLRDYYEIQDLPRPFDIVACQLQNLGWGSRIRRRYAGFVRTGLVLWCAAGVLAGVLNRMSLTDVLMDWYVPSLGLLLLGVDTYQAQQDTVAAREHARKTLLTRTEQYARAGALEAQAVGMLSLARQVQDVLLQTRLTQARVPNWFFNRFLDTDRADFAAAMDELGRLVTTPTTASGQG